MAKKKKHSKSGSASKKRRQAVGTQRSTVEGPHGCSTPQELFDRIFEAASQAFQENSECDQRSAFIHKTIGMVTAAKLLVRLTNGGSLACTLQPGVEYSIEKWSDELLETFQKQLQEGDASAQEMMRAFPAVVFGETAPKEHRVKYLRLVRPGTDWRWVHPPVPLDAVMPPDLVKMFDSSVKVNVSSMELAERIITIFGEARGKATNQINEMISQYCALFAAAKWSLTLWGNQVRAAMVEYLAELESDHMYKELKASSEAEP